MTVFWESVKLELFNGYNVVVMYVLQSRGSSSGRQGFRMVVSESGILSGSIGGGNIEQKLRTMQKKHPSSNIF